MKISKPVTEALRDLEVLVDKKALGLTSHWLLVLNLFLGMFVIMPWVAPTLMAIGYEGPGRLIHFAYSFVCHQLPQRSFFLFGREASYTMTEIMTVWPNADIVGLRQFIGTTEMGYKVAYSDRMVAIHTTLWIAGLLFAFVRRRFRPLPFLWYVALIMPLALDGTSHLINDVLGLSFRDSNAWLHAFTGGIFPTTFYAGDALGSFNSWMRLLTGTIFGLASAWLIYPLLERAFAEVHAALESNSRDVGLVPAGHSLIRTDGVSQPGQGGSDDNKASSARQMRSN